MKYFLSALAASLLITVSAPGVAAPSFPGLGGTVEDYLEPELSPEDLQDQREYREKLELFATALRKWWWDKKNNEPKPIPYVVVSGKKLKLHKDFLKAYLEAREKDKLKEVWTRVERDLKKGFLLEVSG